MARPARNRSRFLVRPGYQDPGSRQRRGAPGRHRDVRGRRVQLQRFGRRSESHARPSVCRHPEGRFLLDGRSRPVPDERRCAPLAAAVQRAEADREAARCPLDGAGRPRRCTGAAHFDLRSQAPGAVSGALQGLAFRAGRPLRFRGGTDYGRGVGAEELAGRVVRDRKLHRTAGVRDRRPQSADGATGAAPRPPAGSPADAVEQVATAMPDSTWW